MRQQYGDHDPETVVLPRIGDTVVLPRIGDTVVLPILNAQPPGQPPTGAVPPLFGTDRPPNGNSETMVLPRFADPDNRAPEQAGNDGIGDGSADDEAVGLPLPDAGGPIDPRVRVKRDWRPAVVRVAWISQFLLAAAAVLVDRPAAAVVVATVFVLPIVSAVVTIRGHHPHEWVRFRLALRRRATRRRRRPDGTRGPLGLLVPRSELTAIPGPGDGQLGVVFDGAGWTAIMSVTTSDTGSAGTWLTRLIKAVEPPAAGTTVQVVLHQRGPGRDGTTGPQRQAWIAMRIDGGDAGAPVNIGSAGIGVVLRTCARRLSLALGEVDLVAVPLDADEVRAALESTMQASVTELRNTAVESWRSWSCAGRTHVSFQVHAWSVPLVAQLLRRIATEDGIITTVSLPIATRDGAAPGAAWVRISHPDPRCVEAIAGALRSSGKGFHRANGRHLPAVLATLPLSHPLS